MAMLRLPSVKTETGHRSDPSIYTKIRDGLFTKPVRVGQRSVGWPSEEVHAITAALIAGKSKEELRELVVSLHKQRTGFMVGQLERGT